MIQSEPRNADPFPKQVSESTEAEEACVKITIPVSMTAGKERRIFLET